MQENHEPVSKRLKTQEPPSFYAQVYQTFSFYFLKLVFLVFIETISFSTNAQSSSATSTIELLVSFFSLFLFLCSISICQILILKKPEYILR
jgi:hypothetical protein